MDRDSVKISSGQMNYMIMLITILSGIFGVFVYAESKFASNERVNSIENKIDAIYNYILNKK